MLISETFGKSQYKLMCNNLQVELYKLDQDIAANIITFYHIKL